MARPLLLASRMNLFNAWFRFPLCAVFACGLIGSGGCSGSAAGTGDRSPAGTGATSGGSGGAGPPPLTGSGGSIAPSGSGGGPAFAGSGGSGFIGTGGSAGPGTGGASSGGGADGDGTAAGGSGSGSGSGGSDGSGGSGGSQGGLQAGTLTAGTWDDNLNFAWYLSYLKRPDVQQVAGLPLIPRDTRLQIVVSDANNAPVAGARVAITDQGGSLLLTAPVRGDGTLFFFPGLANVQPGDLLQITATLAGDTASATANVGDDKVSLRLAATHAKPTATLDLALVVDTTGSMDDELQYLNVEMSNIVSRVATDFPGVSQRWALIVYRDTSDEYVVRTFDFTTSLPTFQQQIAAQKAGGGGDYPESPDEALLAANRLSWRGEPGAGARVLFWIADAPHHVGREATMVSAFATAQKLGIRIYPVAASGADDLLQYTMRTAAEVTGGRYLFLTNDSGVGVAQGHVEPTIPACFFITALNKAMIRMVSTELTGTKVLPSPAEIVRSAGPPDANGKCVLQGGQEVQAL